MFGGWQVVHRTELFRLRSVFCGGGNGGGLHLTSTIKYNDTQTHLKWLALEKHTEDYSLIKEIILKHLNEECEINNLNCKF
jgi:hypothetical protein